MIAVLNTAGDEAWAEALEPVPWCLLPIANRPLLDYWLETCVELGLTKVHIVLGDGAKQVEDYVGDGGNWNLTVEYGFARPNETRRDYLLAMASHWASGLIYLGAPFFIRRGEAYRPEGIQRLEACRYDADEALYFLYGRDDETLRTLLEHADGSSHGLEQVDAQAFFIRSLNDYFELNMKMVGGEFARYMFAGFSVEDSSSIGHNVHTPPSNRLWPPILVGNDCRFGSMTTVGPHAVVADHVIVDAYTELTHCLILQDTYIGRHLEVRDKIVAGNRLIDPADGTIVEVEDSWLVARNHSELRSADVARCVVLWVFTLILLSIQAVPFLLLYTILRLMRVVENNREMFHDPRTGYIHLPVLCECEGRNGPVYRLFRALSLDRTPWLFQVLRGRLFLCGQPPMRHPEDDELIRQLPHYFPGVFCYQDYNKDSDRLVDSLWYAHIRSFYEDLKILVKSLLTRLLRAGRR